MIEASGSVLGIDIGCSPSRRSSAVCRLDWDERTVTWSTARFRAAEPERTEAIARVAGNARLSAAAFDGPLRRGLDVIGRYRAAERMLTRRLQPLIGKPGQASAPVGRLLNAHANDCARVVLTYCDLSEAHHPERIHERAVVEAFPNAFLGVMIGEPNTLNAQRNNRSDKFFEHLAAGGILQALVERCLPGRALAVRPETVTNHDERAALVCALTALCVAADDFVAVGDEDGWIVLPPAELVQPWALDALQVNASEEKGAVLVKRTSINPRCPVLVPSAQRAPNT